MEQRYQCEIGLGEGESEMDRTNKIFQQFGRRIITNSPVPLACNDQNSANNLIKVSVRAYRKLMLQNNQFSVIGPRPEFDVPLTTYQNSEDGNLECYDDFNSKMRQLSSLSMTETPIYQGKKNKRKVRFNLNIVHCQFSQKDPASAIGKLVQKLLYQKPHLRWVNPQISKI